MGAEKAPGGDEPFEGEVATEILDVPPIAVEGSQWGADAEDFNTITLTKQVRTNGEFSKIVIFDTFH